MQNKEESAHKVCVKKIFLFAPKSVTKMLDDQTFDRVKRISSVFSTISVPTTPQTAHLQLNKTTQQP